MHKYSHSYWRYKQKLLRPPPKDTVHYRQDKCFMVISIDGTTVGTIEINLFSKDCPITCQNFASLCLGQKIQAPIPSVASETGKVTGARLWYKGSPFHRVEPGMCVQGGDIGFRNGWGGESIWGGNFDDENFVHKHSRAGLLAMANSGPNSNGSQFYITLAPLPHLDGKHVVFGEVVGGMEVVRAIERLECRNTKPLLSVVIEDCGLIRVDADADDDSDEEATRKRNREQLLSEAARTRDLMDANVQESLRAALARKKENHQKKTPPQQQQQQQQQKQGADDEEDDDSDTNEAAKRRRKMAALRPTLPPPVVESDDDAEEEKDAARDAEKGGK